jgi:hypothetical protein
MSHLLRFTASAINIDDYQKKLTCDHFRQASDPGPCLYGFGTLPLLLSLVHFLRFSRTDFFVFSLLSRLEMIGYQHGPFSWRWSKLRYEGLDDNSQATGHEFGIIFGQKDGIVVELFQFPIVGLCTRDIFGFPASHGKPSDTFQGVFRAWRDTDLTT